MTKSEMLDLIKLLCALEAVGVISYKLPDYLSDRVADAITMLSTKLLEADK
jgi:hypothetical protein